MYEDGVRLRHEPNPPGLSELSGGLGLVCQIGTYLAAIDIFDSRLSEEEVNEIAVVQGVDEVRYWNWEWRDMIKYTINSRVRKREILRTSHVAETDQE